MRIFCQVQGGFAAGQTHLKKLASVAGFRRKTDDFQPVATQKISL